MTVRFSLYTKILLWFFLNLLLLGIAFYFVAQQQFNLGLNSLLAGKAGERIEEMGKYILKELEGKTREEQTQLLNIEGQSHQYRIFLFHNDGQQIAGDEIDLPPVVKNKLMERRPPFRAERPPFARPRPDNDAAPRLPGFDNPDLKRPLRPKQPEGERFLIRSSDPTRYWVGLRLPPPEGTTGRPGPVTLLLSSDSLYGGELLVDFRLWIYVAAGALLFSILFWFPLVRNITRSIAQMTHATGQIAEGRFDVRVNERRRDELGRLGWAINRMAERLSGFVSGQKRFLGDIAHELCSPIARTQMALGILEQRADDKQRLYVEDLREEVQQMSSLVNELLSFSKASLGNSPIPLQKTELNPLLEKAVRREASSGEAVQIQGAEQLSVLAAPDLLLRAVSNLIRNAIRYAGNSGPIVISAISQGQNVILTVADSGPGVPEDALTKIFDPFYRVDLSRNRETGGTGLGLAIVKTCIDACQGSVTARNRKPSGLEVEIVLRRALVS